MIVGTKPKEVNAGDYFKDIRTGLIYIALFTDNSRMTLYGFYDGDLNRKFDPVHHTEMLDKLESGVEKLRWLGNKTVKISLELPVEELTADEILTQLHNDLESYGTISKYSDAVAALKDYAKRLGIK